MTTATIEKTPAEQSKEQAAKQVETLSAERERLQNRKKTAADDATRLHDEIAKAERTGADQKTLAALRSDRTEQEQVAGDVDRVLSHIEQELTRAEAELRDATIACHAERYNEFVAQQRALQAVISEAIDTLAQALRGKEGLAQKQRAIQARDLASLGFQSPERVPEDLRAAFAALIAERLTDPKEMNEFMKSDAVEKIDWPSRKMRADGVVE